MIYFLLIGRGRVRRCAFFLPYNGSSVQVRLDLFRIGCKVRNQDLHALPERLLRVGSLERAAVLLSERHAAGDHLRDVGQDLRISHIGRQIRK